ncbi:hypothetical protein OXYTRIMIC_206 [Oxytricha trifallax]|uniref:Uncharacterized protein n=1 Tax=Oxytricha trifallax TaxID=1172189 RepID=A0A073HYQ6_9SPIT|nr:hypothetical protein OXYTRIMIC_206 [Oxytricha trifallax]
MDQRRSQINLKYPHQNLRDKKSFRIKLKINLQFILMKVNYENNYSDEDREVYAYTHFILPQLLAKDDIHALNEIVHKRKFITEFFLELLQAKFRSIEEQNKAEKVSQIAAKDSGQHLKSSEHYEEMLRLSDLKLSYVELKHKLK